MKKVIAKPKQTAAQLIYRMKAEKGITFKYISEEKAEDFLENRNNYLRTAAYRKNYPKYTKGKNKGKYIGLDFAYLQELSIIDMHFRFIVSKMCLDIEHGLKVKMLKDMEADPLTDGYDIVANFLFANQYVLKNIEISSNSPFTGDLIHKYFAFQQIYIPEKGRKENRISKYDQCPAWVLLELLTFGDFIRFCEYYYLSRNLPSITLPILNLVRSLRNGAAHNNCILFDLTKGASKAPPEISRTIKRVATIRDSQRKKKLSCRPMLEFVSLLYVYKLVVSDKVKCHRIQELRWLFYDRMLQKKDFFKENDLIKSNYEFACKVIEAFF